MSDFARMRAYIVVEAEDAPLGKETASRKITNLDIPWNVEAAEEAAEGMAELLNVLDLEEWFKNCRIKKQV